MALLCEACGQFQKSCDAPAGVCISPPASPCLSDSPRSSAWTSGSPSWGSHGRQPPCPGHGGFTTSFLTPEHSSKITAPLKEKPTHPTVSELLQQEPPHPTPPHRTLHAGEAPWNLSSRTFLLISQAPLSSASVPALLWLGLASGCQHLALPSPFLKVQVLLSVGF